ncbi:MAG: N-formylglutamate amidohydrolase [Gemmataceae bacterium]|nr:N-formylglutamate amidohydrolase [Gemmataceae bacterium]
MPLYRLAFLLAVPLALLPGVRARPDISPKPEDLVYTQKGTLPVIVSAPHGGGKAVPGVAERRGVGIKLFTTARDGNTAELARTFAAELEKELGGKPWVVVARFDRKYIDANRPPDGAYEAEAAKPYYDAYHDPLTAACKAVREAYGGGLLLDVHGQGALPDVICRGTRNGTTVKLLKDRHGWRAVTGKNSVMGRLERAGYKVMPACDAGEDAREEVRFAGGHIVNTYGSHTGYAIDAIQVEVGTKYRDRDTYAKTARDLAAAVAAFHDEYLKK